MEDYIFHRQEGFYTINLKNNEDAIKNAETNIGTIKVTDLRGSVVWAKNNPDDLITCEICGEKEAEDLAKSFEDQDNESYQICVGCFLSLI